MSIGSIKAWCVKKEDKQYFNCIIKEVACVYGSDKKAVLYSHDDIEKAAEIRRNQDKCPVTEGVYALSLTYVDTPHYFFISNHEGKKVNFLCEREKNSCTDEKHTKYRIDSYDLDTRRLERGEERAVTETNYTIYYYNLFYRASLYAESARQYMGNTIDVPMNQNDPFLGKKIVGKAMAMGVADVSGRLAGSTLDFLFALRFVTLPIIKESDEAYYYQIVLHYNECFHNHRITPIHIQVYPDIEYSLKIDFNAGKIRGIETTYNGAKYEPDKQKTKGALFSFKVKYATIEKELGVEDLESSNTKELDKATKKGTLFYKSIRELQKTFKSINQMSSDLENTLTKATGREGNDKADWITGKIEIQPSLSCKWHYYVPDDLTEVKRFIEATIGLEGKATLKIDLIKLTQLALNKSKKARYALGIGALPVAFLFFVVDQVLPWLVKKIPESIKEHVELKFKAYVEFSCEAKLKPVVFNSISNSHFQSSLELELGIKLFIGIEGKIDIQSIVKVSVKGKASGTAKVAIKIGIEVKAIEGDLGLELGAEIPPVTISVDYGLIGSFTICKKEKKEEDLAKINLGQSGNPYEIKFGGCKWGPIRYDLFPKDKDA